MIENIKAYIKSIDKRYQTGETTEHSFRGDLQQLLEDTTDYLVINEQKRINCGAPDLALYKKNVPYAYVEAKDLEVGDLDGRKKNKEQFDRYKASLNTIIFTDYLDFHLYEDGSLISKVELAYIDKGHIVLNEEAVPRFISIIEHLKMLRPQEISSSSKLSKIMASKSRMLADVIETILANDEFQTGSFWSKLRAFKEVLNNDLDEKRFADLYAQTIAYGLFAARLHDKTPNDFSRQEAAELIPKTNPFLRQIFQQLAGFDINDSIAWIVDDLVNVFASVNVEKLRKNFSKEQQRRDPMIHFYEEFLSEYDPESKKKFGVYYTPQPVVEFIVRAVDDILKTDFNLPDGLADKSKVNVPIRKMEDGKDVETVTIEPRHRVQILDPATGTGTFLAEVVSRIKEKQQAGIWPKYVDEHLIPRIHGFELMMAPYTIAHLKLDMLISWWGDQKLEKEHDDRVQIYLTNSLSRAALANKYLLAEMIAREANEANNIKHNAPVMVMIGNPPYSVSSTNKSPWILNLIEDYKKNLNEKKLNLDDDYIKFIRLGQYYIERTGEGILAYITNNSFIDGVTHRQMRRELMRCFDDIYILDLHGNMRKNEKSPDGSKDENVFSIMQGVCINIFVKKNGNAGRSAIVHHYDLYGQRKEKYAFLTENTLSTIKWQILQPMEPNLFFVPKDFSLQEEYRKGFSIISLMPCNNSAIKTDRDSLFYDTDKDDLSKRISNLLGGIIDNNFIETYNVKDSSSYKISQKIKGVSYNKEKIAICQYRPFDFQYLYYDPRVISRPAENAIKHFIGHDNIGFVIRRTAENTNEWSQILVTSFLVDINALSAQTYVTPLYLYPSESELGFDSERKPNLDETIWRSIENWIKYGQAYKPLTANEQSGELGFDAAPEEPHFLAPEDIFDYIYGVLHSPHYREKYKEFLKVDFPRIPYPKNADEFEHYKEYGHKLRELHLMHSVPESAVRFDIPGSCKVEQIRPIPNKDDGYSYSIFINDDQFFSNVPAEAWEMYIGGYQPAQKWLKDRKGRTLSTDDIEHYEKIISVLIETAHIMSKIDNPAEQVEELKKKVQDLEHQLQAQQSSEIHYHVDINGPVGTYINTVNNLKTE